MVWQEAVNRNIWVASREATLKSPAVGGHWVVRHWEYLNGIILLYIRHDSTQLSWSSQALYQNRSYYHPNYTDGHSGSESLNDLLEVGHLADCEVGSAGSKAGALHHESMQNTFFIEPYEILRDFQFYYDMQLSRSTFT